MWLSALKKRPPKSEKITQAISDLTKLIPHSDWFIAGGAALDPSTASDIDVFFTSQLAFEQALAAIPTASATKVVHAYDTSHFGFPVQFIFNFTGTPDSILSHFDLYCCRKAILPDGSTYVAPSYSPLVSVDPTCFRAGLANRIGKYIRNKEIEPDYSNLVSTVSYLISTGDVQVETFYGDLLKSSHQSHSFIASKLVDCFRYLPSDSPAYPARAKFLDLLEQEAPEALI